MTETDTRLCCNCGVTLDGYSGLRHYGTYTTHSHADCIRNLTARAEKAEAERDTAWNDAIEAAAKYHDNFLITKTWADVEKVVASTAAIRALKKGGTP